ncbi:hypothetical protein N8I71_08045 [Roseibacterium sp. SDUM158016]|jgi:hypothetical protein|uniref:hypothetical protein n=1 Tax=Roseicyclus sediminis TaxID=2980997 RepID=UPI0021D0A041|nr:hypothetical protein [Roseibacterium sp. SDUM158016]MCU4652780.1 hypothetical protein [Roseibacterium sp. SDUM158016]
MTPGTLAQMRKRLPDCELVLYADIVSGTVLASDSRLVYPQENLDTLCVCARGFLTAPRLASHDTTGEAVFRTPTATRVFMRAYGDPCEALVCVCGPKTDLAAVLDAMREALAEAAPDNGSNVVAFREAMSK